MVDDTSLPPALPPVGELPAEKPAEPVEPPRPEADQPMAGKSDWGIGKVAMTPIAPAPAEETLVIPPAGESAANPFIPQGTAPQESAPPPPGGNPLVKRIFTILLILLVIIGIGAGACFAYQRLGGPKEVTLTYWGLWENNTTLQTMINDFQTKNPKIKIQYVKQSARQYRERLQAAIARGEGPDVFEFHNTWVPMLQNELSPAPGTVMTSSEFSSTFYPVAAADLVGGTSVYGIPMMIDGLGLYYNIDLLSTAGVTPPTTWPELLDIVPKLTVRADTQVQKSAIALGTTGNVENFSDILALMMMQNGAKLISPTGKEAEDTLTFYRKFSNPSDPVYTWNETMDNSVYAFATGKVAMIIAPSWRVFDIKQISPNLNFKIVGVPQLPGNTINWASYWVEGVSTKSKSPEAAWTLVKYLTSRDTVTTLYAEAAKSRLFGQPYARVDLASTLSSDPYVGAYITGAPTAKSFPLSSRTFDNGINDKLIQYLTDAVNAVGQGTAPVQALDTMSQGFTQVLGSYGLSAGATGATPTP
jgi:multiple sugar transport system substrate-binding protein